MICWGINRDFSGFEDRPQEGVDPRLVDLRNARDAGIAALSVDIFVTDRHAIPTFGKLATLIQSNDPPIERYGSLDCVVRTGGRPVIFTFNANRVRPEAWRTILAGLKARGYEGHWVGEMGRLLSLGAAPDSEGAKPWLDIFDAGNMFTGRDPDRIQLGDRIHALLRARGRTQALVASPAARPVRAACAALQNFSGRVSGQDTPEERLMIQIRVPFEMNSPVGHHAPQATHDV